MTESALNTIRHERHAGAEDSLDELSFKDVPQALTLRDQTWELTLESCPQVAVVLNQADQHGLLQGLNSRREKIDLHVIFQGDHGIQLQSHARVARYGLSVETKLRELAALLSRLLRVSILEHQELRRTRTERGREVERICIGDGGSIGVGDAWKRALTS